MLGGSLQRRLWLDRIGLIVLAGSSGSYWLDRIGWIVLVLVLVLLGENGSYKLAGLLLAGWDGWTKWGVDVTGVGRTDVSTNWNKSATMGAGTGAPLLDLEGWMAIGSSGWNQLRRC